MLAGVLVGITNINQFCAFSDAGIGLRGERRGSDMAAPYGQ
jgi:hypothetical protein